MTRECFLHIEQSLPQRQQQSDKFFKIRPLVQRLNHLFVQKHSPSKYVSVDELIIRFKGRTSLKQYNPMKPIWREYKLWCVADNDGYVYKFEVYTGKIFGRELCSKSWFDRQCCYQLTDWLQGKYYSHF